MDTSATLPPTLTLSEFGIVIAVPIPDPQPFHLESLQQPGLIPPSGRLVTPPLYAPQKSLLKFESGTLVVQPDRIGFSQRLPSNLPRSIWSVECSRRLVQQFPQLIYEGIGIQLTGHVACPDDPTFVERYFKQTLLAPGQWQQVEQVAPVLKLEFAYPLAQSQRALHR